MMYFCSFLLSPFEALISFVPGCDSSIMSLMFTVGLAAEILTAEAISIPLNNFLNRLFMVVMSLVK